MISQSASRIMLVKPVVFGFNPQTSQTNVFQSQVFLESEQVYKTALRELESVYRMYADEGVAVEVFESANPLTPDAIFPNSVSTFAGEVFKSKTPVAVLHPMNDENRRAERSPELIGFFKNLGYHVIDDLLKYEAQGLALEGTGSVVMDHVNKIAYCALSKRSNLKIAQAYAEMIGYRLEAFDTLDEGVPVYHTDLVMNINTGFAEVCSPVIVEKDRARILKSLRDTGRDVIEHNMRQFKSFCGNSLEVRNARGEKLFSTSTRAHKARSSKQNEIILRHVDKIIHTKLRMIERVGGGSDRCLTQELHGLDQLPPPSRKPENFFRTLAI